ncbi:MAG: response regulator transcription factor [Candidatus Electryonea clarkiae]|nr:response regulator transcription factor [Candidatus Electryonea clarkiae]MDP8288884.1 response regulator transcription factor [Candidatus Electryonea clarkiae]
MINVLIVDDHEIVRKGLIQVLASDRGIAVTGEADDGNDALEKIRNYDYDVVILDISLPGRSGLDILRQIKQEKPDLPVLILSIYSEAQYALSAIKAGAYGYLTKDVAKYELIEAIRSLASGRKYITKSLAARLANAFDMDNKGLPHELLSDREFQVMLMIATGKSNRDSAGELFLSQNTISTYRQRILEKMNMSSNADLIHYAIKHKLID